MLAEYLNDCFGADTVTPVFTGRRPLPLHRCRSSPSMEGQQRVDFDLSPTPAKRRHCSPYPTFCERAPPGPAGAGAGHVRAPARAAQRPRTAGRGIRPVARRQLGNFPQAFSQLALADTASNLGSVRGAAMRRPARHASTFQECHAVVWVSSPPDCDTFIPQASIACCSKPPHFFGVKTC